jgi:hypothetical protein
LIVSAIVFELMLYNLDGSVTDEHPLESDIVDAGVEDKGEMTRFRNCRPPICSAEGDFTVGPGQESGIRDEIIGIDDAQASTLQ